MTTVHKDVTERLHGINKNLFEEVKGVLNKNKEHRMARVKYEAKDKYAYVSEQKKNGIKSQLVWMKTNKASLIAYFRMYEMYCEKLHLKWSIPLLAKIIKPIQKRLLRNEFNWSRKLDEIH